MALNRAWIPSPNVSDRGGSGVRLLVMHTAEGALTYQALGSYFGNPSSQVSSHVGIDDTPGTIGEYVSWDRKAWTQANANPYCVAAETCAFAAWDRATWLQHPNMLNNAGDWVGEETKRFGIPLVLLNSAQAQGGSPGVCEHVNLGAAGGGHSDCGGQFPWDVVMARAGGGTPSVPVPPATPPGLNKAMVAMGATSAGYHLFAGDGGVFTCGDAPFYGSMASAPLNAPVVGGCSRVDGSGYYMVAADGGIFTFGPGCPFLGSMGGQPLNAPVAGMMADPDGTGYWLVANDGGVFSFEAPFHGSMGGQRLNAPVVACAPVSGGYLMAGADGGVFTFGAAQFHGGMGGQRLNAPIVGMAAQPDGSGYWLCGSDGGVFTFGNAPFHGGMGGQPLNWPVVGMAENPGGDGYWMVAADGGVFSQGAPFYGSGVQS